jgi:ProQ/FINO family
MLLCMMRQRKSEKFLKPTVVVRKKKPQHATPADQSEQSATSAQRVSRPLSPPAITPASQTTLSRRPSRTVPAVVSQTAPLAPQPEGTPALPNRRQRKAQAPYQLLEVLRTRWPAAFPQDPRLIRPLMRGIHREIAQLQPGTALWLIKRAIILFQGHSGGAYWRAVMRGGHRYGLDGTPCGEVTPEEQEHAKQTLAVLANRHEGKRHAPSKSREPLPSVPE